MVLLVWSNRYRNSTVVIKIGLTSTKYPYHKLQWIFYSLGRCFISSITCYQTWLYIWVRRRVSYTKQELLPFCENLSSPRDIVWSVIFIFLIFCIVLLCVYAFWILNIVMSVIISAYNRCLVRLYLHFFEGGIKSYLRYLCLHSGVQHILCCVLVLICFVLWTLCCQFLWIVHFWLPLLYSLTFIKWISSSFHLEFLVLVMI
jgi:hypothetical protein